MQARYLIPIFISHLLRNAFCETHCAINENDNSRISFVGDSPFSLRQPHSLIDLIKQVEMVKEKISLKASIKQQEVLLIEKRYNDDDPDIEKRIHNTDENCLKSKSLDLRTERFIVTYPIDLVPYFVYNMRFNREMIASTIETLQLFTLERIFDVNAKPKDTENAEPRCTDHDLMDIEKDEETDNNANVAEPELVNLNAEEMEKLSFYLNDRLKQKSTRNLALYYTHFYWRIRGDTRHAIKCLLALAEDDSARTSVNFQLASLYIRVGKYNEAVNILKSVVDEIDGCAECHAALGDAYVLVGNFIAAVVAFDQAVAKASSRPAISETATMKAALLRCVLKVFEVMEYQHSTLLDTIDDVNEFKDKSTRLKLLNVLIEANRASSETRLQAKLAYEHYLAGPVPHLNCYGVAQSFLSVFSANSLSDPSFKMASVNIDENSLERLHCVVDDLDAFNASLLIRYRELLEAAFKEKKIVLENESNRPSRAELFRAQLFNFLQESNAGLVEYAKKLAPYMSMEIDMPSQEPRYPQNRTKQRRPKIEKCSSKENYNSDERLLAADAFHLFMSPDNKGYIVSDILTKYLALSDGELSPLPWNLPTCRKFAAATRTSQINDENLAKLDSLNKLLDNPAKVFSVGDKHLEQLLLSLPIGDDGNFGQVNMPKILLGELGQRIATLLKYRVGADWISLNLAALYLRYFGHYKEAAICLQSALQLKKSPHKDIAYTQMAQIFIQLAATSSKNDDTRFNQLKDANVLLRLANQKDPNEPIPLFLLGVVAEMMFDDISLQLDSVTENSSNALNYYWTALAMEQNFLEARRAILHIKCAKQLTTSVDETPTFLTRSFLNENPPLCCWPNEQEVYCFKRSKSNLQSHNTILKNIGPEELCYTLENRLEPDVTLIYFRCNVMYTGRSYPPPPYAQIIASFLRPAEKLRHLLRQRFVKMIDDNDDEENKAKTAHGLDETPVLALDYGGYSESRIQAHQAKFSRPSDAELHQSVIILTNETASENETYIYSDENKAVEEKIEKSKIAESKFLHPNSPHFLTAFANIIDIHNVLQYDITKPTNVPPPMDELVKLGKQFFPLVQENLSDYCKAYKKSERILEQPASTYVSVTAKGIRIHESFLAAPSKASANEEPFCPEANQDASATLMNELDALPAYQLRQHLKFYRPETALRDVLQSLRETPSATIAGSNRRMRIDETAARLAHAMRTSQIRDGDVDWTLSGASSLYWRVKGDAINAIKCLRHSLGNSPDEMKDIALISMANIYQQAGFHHSALVIGGKALRVSPDSVVAIHFTLANIYASINDFSNALAFYYSSLALQSRFDGAKDRIRAIHCKTSGKMLH